MLIRGADKWILLHLLKARQVIFPFIASVLSFIFKKARRKNGVDFKQESEYAHFPKMWNYVFE